ncbi:SIR2 family protein [Shewanella algae]|uniref:SIR2 family protein n=1 Tax=Shewanella algae TaxID=38313 RepID=UPI0031F48261
MDAKTSSQGNMADLDHKRRHIKDLIEYIKTRSDNRTPNYNVLIGAGASVTSGISSGADLVEKWRAELFESCSGEKYENEKKAREYLLMKESHWYSESNEYSSLFEKKFDLPSQRRTFVENEIDGKEPSIGYAYLTSLMDNPKDRFFSTVFTTNFDDLLNEAFYHFSNVRPQLCAHDSSVKSIAINSSRPAIIKLHGDYLFDDIKSTQRETESLEANMRNKFIEFSKNFGLIVVGYSGHDRSIMDVISMLLKSEDYFKKGIYWCVRKGSKISSELRKLLWKDGVYFVEVEGFDELFAEIHSELVGPLTLKNSFYDSKRELIIDKFTKDSHELRSTSPIIRRDLDNILNVRNQQEISKLIQKINGKGDDFSSDISNERFLKFLEVESLVVSKNYEDAYQKCLSNYNELNSEDSKNNDLMKLIDLALYTNRLSDCFKYADQLIALDNYNPSYYIKKAELYDKPMEVFDFIRVKNDKLKHYVEYNNFVSKIGIKCIKSHHMTNTSQVMRHINHSLELDSSLDNVAWTYKVDLLKEIKGKDISKAETIQKEIDEIIAKVEKINNKSFRYINLIMQNCKNTMSSIEDIISKSKAIFKVSHRKKQIAIFKGVCNFVMERDYFDNKEVVFLTLAESIINDDTFSSIKKEDYAIYHLLLLLYKLNKKEGLSKSVSSLKEAVLCRDSGEYKSKIFYYMLKFYDDLDIAEDYLNAMKADMLYSDYLQFKMDLASEKDDFKQALSIANDNRFVMTDDTLCAICFIYLRQGNYQKVLNFYDENKDSNLFDESSSAIFLINYLAAKNLKDGNEIDKGVLQKIIAKKLGTFINLGCYCLMNDEVSIKRLIAQAFNSNINSYSSLKSWVILDEKYLEPYKEFFLN